MKFDDSSLASVPSAPALQINAWYFDDVARVHPIVEEVLRDAGFVFEPLPRTFGSWSLVTLEGVKVWSGLRVASDGQCVVDIQAGGEVGRFVGMFDQMIAHRVVPAECALTAARSDVYPFFTDQRFRLSGPITLVHEGRESTPADDGYWADVGRAMHFVSAATLRRFGVEAAAWAAKIRAPAIRTQEGVVFDCGWSRTWPMRG